MRRLEPVNNIALKRYTFERKDEFGVPGELYYALKPVPLACPYARTKLGAAVRGMHKVFRRESLMVGWATRCT